MTELAPLISNIAQLSAAVLATAASLRRSHLSEGAESPAWRFIALSTGSWATGEALWCWSEVILRRPAPFPSVADLAFLASIPFALIGMMAFVRTPAGHLSRLRALIEGAAIASGLLLASWILLLSTVVRSSEERPLARMVSLAYPIGDCLLLAVAVFAMTRRSRRHGCGVGVLASGFAFIAVADTAFAVLQESGGYTSGRLVDLGWIVGFGLVAVAALRRADRPTTRFERLVGCVARLRPFVPPVVAGIATVVGLLRGRPDPTALVIAASAVALLVVLQLEVSLENQVLTADLEVRIARRTEQLAHRDLLFAALVEHSSDVTFMLDESGVIEYVSGSVRAAMGTEPADLVGRSFAGLIDPDDRPAIVAAVSSADGPTAGVRVEAMVAGGGRLHPLELTITNLLREAAIGAIVVNGRDIRERRMFEEQLRHDALHDALTGLPNRRLLLEHIERSLSGRRSATDGTSAVAMIDLDDFKAVNDGFGHQVGDEFLVEIARRLRAAVRPQDTAARLGGDEFAVVLATTSPEDVMAAADRLLEVLQLPIDVGGVQVAGRASIGVRIVTADTTPALLLRDADIALYAAKSSGKARVEQFAPELGERAARRLALKADLRNAWRRGEISVVFQPIVDMASRRLRGAEALVRWTHPQFGSVSPSEFIPLAEETGVIVDLGRSVLEDACLHAERWCRSGAMSYVSVNVSPVQLAEAGFLAAVDDALSTSGLAPHRLLLEVTEGVLFSNFDAAVSALAALRSRGVRTAIDDFGTGYSSLAYAQKLPIDVVKIDRCFVLEAASGTSIIPAIMQIAQLLDADVVAEGIETTDQAGILGDRGCTLGQGYLYSPPVPPATFERFILEDEVRPAGAARTNVSSVRPDESPSRVIRSDERPSTFA